MNNDEKGILFIENHEPVLKVGEYQLKLSLHVDITKQGQEEKDHFGGEHTLYVEGTPFVLREEDIDSYYPFAEEGDFSSVLPHIVLKQAGLPWQRDMKANKVPWLALLLFDENDPIPNLSSVPASDWESSLPSDTFSPMKKINFQNYKENIQFIDIPLELFNAVVPSLNDLPFLAHTRKVDITNKAFSHARMPVFNKMEVDDDPSNNEYAVVVANRFPGFNKSDEPHSVGLKNRVYVISLEEYSEHLPDKGGVSKIPDAFTKVRLIALKYWDFSVVKKVVSLTAYMEQLNKTPSYFRLKNLEEANSDQALQDVNDALNMGYIPIDHHTRQDDKLVSWYRGPLIPYQNEATGIKSINHSDDAVSYNPSLGMFDVSYSSAWLLGKLLALQNIHFASAMVRTRKTLIQKTLKLLQLQSNLNFYKLSKPSNEELFSGLLNKLANSLNKFLTKEKE